MPAARKSPAPTPQMVRNSERRDFKRCPQRWWWAWRDGLVIPSANESNALWFGTGMHLALEHWYCGPGTQRGADPLKVWSDYVAQELRVLRTNDGTAEEDSFVEAAELGTAMLQAYFEEYGDDDDWDVISAEQDFQIDIPRSPQTTAEQAGPRDPQSVVRYCGTFDLVYRSRDSGQIWIVDHKNVKSIDTKHLELDDQAGGYWAAATAVLRHQGKIGSKETLAGITYNFLRKGKPDARPRNAVGHYLNKDGTVSKNQPASLFLRHDVHRTRREQVRQFRRIADESAHIAAVERGELPLFKNPTRDCSWDCRFYEMCELHEQSSDWEEFRDAIFTRADPYEAHR